MYSYFKCVSMFEVVLLELHVMSPSYKLTYKKKKQIVIVNNQKITKTYI